MKFAKVLLLIVCACTLQGCATYYYSSPPGAQRVTSSEDGYYYGSGVGYATIDYSAARYYPWWSMDYYYLGPHYYSPWHAGYASGWYTSLGFNFGYPPYYHPYGYSGIFYYPAFGFGRYDPWYGWPYYGPGIRFAWYDTYWRNQYRNHASERYPDYGNSRYGQRDLRRDLYADPRDRAPASYSAERAAAGSRNVSTAPSYRTGESGMQVRSRRDRKVEESRIGPAPVQSPPVPATRARSISVAPVNPSPAQATPPETSQNVVSPPRPVYQAPPPQARQRETARPVTAPSRDSRPAPLPRSKPSKPPPRSAPPRPSPRPDTSDRRSPAYSETESRPRN